MKWFIKYCNLKHKYDELLAKYLDLFNMIDSDFWDSYLHD